MNTTNNIVSIITNSITSIISSVISSINNNLYEFLDDLFFIDNDIISDESFKNILGSNTSGIILICNAIIIAICLYYSFSLLLSYITFSQVQNPLQFFFKLLLCTILLNFSFFICDKIIYIIACISRAIRNIGEQLFDVPICFSSFLQAFSSEAIASNISLLSFGGILKIIISIGMLSLMFSYSLRFVMIKVFVLISPFAFASLTIKDFSWIFKSWIKIFLSLLVLEILVPLIMLVGYSLNLNSTTTFSAVYSIGIIYALIRSNYFIKEFMGGITTDINLNLSSLKKSYFNRG